MRAREVDTANVRSWQVAAQPLEEETYTLYLSYRNPRPPASARIFVALLVGYVSSPIDLIPDSIPVVGLLDKMSLVPLGVILARKMMPAAVVAECRVKSRKVMRGSKKPVSRAAAVVVVDVWLLLATLGVALAFRIAQGFCA